MTETLEAPTTGADSSEPVPVGAYTEAVEAFLTGATWLDAMDLPLKVHARTLATSLDKQMREKGEIQSAMASSFDKVIARLSARRPPPAPAPGSGIPGQIDIFEAGFDT